MNWDSVREKIDAHNLPSLDARHVRELISDTYDTFAEDDLQYFELVSNEEEFIVPTERGIKFKGFIDLVFRIKEVPPYLRKQGAQVGDLVAVDWKTSNLNFSNSYGVGKFRDTFETSWQWKAYLCLGLPDANYFLYRGISKQPEGGLVQLPLKGYEGMKGEVENAIFQSHNAIKSQYQESLPWFKVMPTGCAKYGVECPYLKTCKLGTPPEYLATVGPPLERLSYSSIEEFWTCPERWRRGRLEGVEAVESDASRLGAAFHSGISEVYRQLYGK